MESLSRLFKLFNLSHHNQSSEQVYVSKLFETRKLILI